MSDLNNVTLTGRLGQDPAFFGNGNQGARIRLAVNRTFGSGDERQQRTDWITVVCWGGLVQSAQHLSKGDRIGLTGELRTNEFTDRDGVDRQSTEVHARTLEFFDVRGRAKDEGKAKKKAKTKKGKRTAGAANDAEDIQF